MNAKNAIFDPKNELKVIGKSRKKGWKSPNATKRCRQGVKIDENGSTPTKKWLKWTKTCQKLDVKGSKSFWKARKGLQTMEKCGSGVNSIKSGQNLPYLAKMGYKAVFLAGNQDGEK